MNCQGCETQTDYLIRRNGMFCCERCDAQLGEPWWDRD